MIKNIRVLQVMTDHYCNLVNSGDAGNWDPESETPVINARKVLSGDNWIKHDGSKHVDEGGYWVMSSYGVRRASYHNWGDCFQDSATNNDEDMCNSRGEVFTVSHYMPIVEPKPPEGE